mgnify:CR=1 FL=1
MWIKKKEVEQLSEFVKGYISGEEPDIRDNREGVFNILKNDIYSLVNKKRLKLLNRKEITFLIIWRIYPISLKLQLLP